MVKKLEFGLSASIVPAPPQPADSWPDVLRWLVMVMDPMDTRFSFVAGCLSYVIKYGALSERQAVVCNEIWSSIQDDYHSGILLCQNTVDEVYSFELENAKRLN